MSDPAFRPQGTAASFSVEASASSPAPATNTPLSHLSPETVANLAALFSGKGASPWSKPRANRNRSLV